MARSRSQLDAVIPNGGTDSATVTVPPNSTLLGVHIPASMTGTTLKFKVLDSAAGAPKLLKKIDNTDYTLTIGASASYFPVDIAMFEGVRFLQLVSGATETAAKTLKLEFGQTA